MTATPTTATSLSSSMEFSTDETDINLISTTAGTTKESTTYINPTTTVQTDGES